MPSYVIKLHVNYFLAVAVFYLVKIIGDSFRMGFCADSSKLLTSRCIPIFTTDTDNRKGMVNK